MLGSLENIAGTLALGLGFYFTLSPHQAAATGQHHAPRHALEQHLA